MPFIRLAAIIFTRYYKATFITLLFSLSQTKHWFHLSEWYNLVVLCCFIWSILNCFFILSPFPTFTCLYKLWKPFLPQHRLSYRVYTPYTSSCNGNHGVIACTSQKTYDPVTVVTMAIRAWLTLSLTQGYYVRSVTYLSHDGLQGYLLIILFLMYLRLVKQWRYSKSTINSRKFCYSGATKLRPYVSITSQ
jgi:hypothetical protein